MDVLWLCLQATDEARQVEQPKSDGACQFTFTEETGRGNGEKVF